MLKKVPDHLVEKTLPKGFTFKNIRGSLSVSWIDEDGENRSALCDGGGDIAGPCFAPDHENAPYLPRGWPCMHWPLGLDRPRIERWLKYAECMIGMNADHINEDDPSYGWNTLYRSTKLLLWKLRAISKEDFGRVVFTRGEALERVQNWNQYYSDTMFAHERAPLVGSSPTKKRRHQKGVSK